MATLEDLSNKNAKFFLKITKRKSDPEEKKPKELRLDLDPIMTKENVLAAKNIHVRGRLVVFEEARDSVQVDLWALMDNRPPMIYRDVNVQRGYDLSPDVHKYLLVRPVTPGHMVNKRAAFRVKVGMPCTITAHTANLSFNGRVKDVSSSGFAVEVSNANLTEKLALRESLIVEFTDPVFSEKKIRVEGALVRSEKGKAITLFGCQCRDVPKEYMNYVMKKQTSKSHA